MKQKQALKEYLREHYKHILEQVREASTKQQEDIRRAYAQQARKEAQALLQTRERASKQEAVNAISQEKVRQRTQIDHAIHQKAQEALKIIEEKKRNDTKLLETYKKQLTKAIDDDGYEVDEFHEHIDEARLLVRIENDDVVYEQSLREELDKEEKRIKHAINQKI